MKKNEIVIDSTYRDRVRFPNSANMQVSIQKAYTDLHVNNVSPSAVVYPNPMMRTTAYAVRGVYDNIPPNDPGGLSSVLTSVSRDLFVEGNYFLIDTFEEEIGDFITKQQTPGIGRFSNFYNNYIFQLSNDDYWDREQASSDEGTFSNLTNPYVIHSTISSTRYTDFGMVLEDDYLLHPAIVFNNTSGSIDNTSQFQLSLWSSSIDNYYVSKFMRIGSQTLQIYKYDGYRRLVTVAGFSSSVVNLDYFITTNEQWVVILDSALASPLQGNEVNTKYPAHRQLTNRVWGMSSDMARFVYTIHNKEPVTTGRISIASSTTSKVTLNSVVGIRTNMWFVPTNKTQIYTRFYIDTYAGAIDDLSSTVTFNLFVTRPIVTGEMNGMDFQFSIPCQKPGVVTTYSTLPVGGKILTSVPYALSSNQTYMPYSSFNTFDTNLVSAAYGNNGYVFVKLDTIITGADIANRHSLSSQTVLGDWTSVAFSPLLSLFVVVGSGNETLYSPDGITWITVTITGNSYRQVVWVPQLAIFVAVGTGLDNVATTNDGENWIFYQLGLFSLYSVTFRNDTVVAAIVAISNSLYVTSGNGVTWTSYAVPTKSWTSITYGQGLFVAVNSDATSLTTMNMVSPTNIGAWTFFGSSAMPILSPLYAIEYIPDRNIFVTVGAGVRMKSSIPAFGSWDWDIVTTPPRFTGTVKNLNNGDFLKWIPDTNMLVQLGIDIVYTDVPCFGATITVQGGFPIPAQVIQGVYTLNYVNILGASPAPTPLPGSTITLFPGFISVEWYSFPSDLSYNYGYIFRDNPNYGSYSLIKTISGNELTLSTPLVEPLDVYDNYEIWYEGEEYYRALNNTVIQHDREACYDIELTSIILPNRQLLTGSGGRIAFYPYIYVEFYCNNINTTFSSNNPHSTHSSFKIPIYNVDSPESTPWVRLSSLGMVDRIKYYPWETYTLRVILPNGEVFTIEPDTIPPLVPVQWLQVFYTISLKKTSQETKIKTIK